jgi:hypothetical protein
VLWYGDRERRVDPGDALAALRARAARAAREPPGAGRHAALVGVLVDAGILAQGIADAAFAARGGVDAPDRATAAAMRIALAAARAVVASWRAGAVGAELRAAAALRRLARLLARAPPEPLALREPEGYAHYALYPELFLEAAAGLRAPVLVVGIRSVGTSLAAVVAAAAGAPAPLTVRPVGHPHDRRLSLAPAFAARLARDARRGARFLVVDEGPGLSGSSFAAVARALDDAGAARARVTFLPGHAGPPGPAASAAWRARWDGADRRVVPFERAVLDPARGLARWIAEVAGPVEHLRELSAGAWRPVALPEPARWPAVFRQQERRKFLARAGGRELVAEFVGLGATGEARWARARALGDAGLSPRPLALVHGFLLRPWIAGAPGAGAPDEALVARVAEHLAFRARAFPGGDGATPDELLRMLRFNAGAALGAEAARAAERFAEGARLAARERRPIAVDGKPEPFEWIAAGGRLLKLDAVQHADAHDLAGAQDVGWDVAAAAVELGLPRAELAARVARATGAALAPAALDFQEAAWCALRLGRWHYALATEGDPAERARIEAELARSRALLAARLGAG